MITSKQIVMIDDYVELGEAVTVILEEKGFAVHFFSTFHEAIPFIETHVPDLIISDLMGHDNMTGVDFYIRHIMQKNIHFAIWTGSIDLSDTEHAKDFNLFLEEMPRGFRLTYNITDALSNREADLIIEDSIRNQKAIVPIFPKPREHCVQAILDYFRM